jgi:hypothetical protein
MVKKPEGGRVVVWVFIRRDGMELRWPNGWFIINRRQIRSVEYYIEYNGRHFSSDTGLKDISQDAREGDTPRMFSVEVTRPGKNEVLKVRVSKGGGDFLCEDRKNK